MNQSIKNARESCSLSMSICVPLPCPMWHPETESEKKDIGKRPKSDCVYRVCLVGKGACVQGSLVCSFDSQLLGKLASVGKKFGSEGDGETYESMCRNVSCVYRTKRTECVVGGCFVLVQERREVQMATPVLWVLRPPSRLKRPPNLARTPCFGCWRRCSLSAAHRAASTA